MTIKQKSKQWQYFNPFDPYLLSNVQNTFLSCLYTPEFAALSWISKLCWCGPQYLLTVLPFLISTLLSGVTFTPPPHCNTAPAFHTHTRAHLYSHTYTHAHVNPQASSCPHPHPPLPNCTSKACSITSKKTQKFHLSLLTHGDTLRSDLNISQGDSSDNEMLLAQCLLLSKRCLWFWRAFRKNVMLRHHCKNPQNTISNLIKDSITCWN